jgi:hypothetical protein
MNEPGLSASDWINIVIAIGVVATAVFTAVAARATTQQARLYAPVITFRLSKNGPPHLLWVDLIPADRERFMIAKLSVPWLRRARLFGVEERIGPGGTPNFQPSGSGARSVAMQGGRSAVFVDPRGAEAATVRVHIASRADSKARSRRTIRISMKD